MLPDFATNNPGFVRQPAHLRKVPLTEEEARMPVLFVENERFSAPELLFNPSDIGIFYLIYGSASVGPILGRKRGPEFPSSEAMLTCFHRSGSSWPTSNYRSLYLPFAYGRSGFVLGKHWPRWGKCQIFRHRRATVSDRSCFTCASTAEINVLNGASLTELQPLAPPDCEVSVYKASE